MHKNGMRPIHPGEILKEEFLEPLGVTPAALARALHVSAPTVNDIVRERRNISADVALRLATALGTSAQFWLNLQASYDLRKAEIEKGEEIYRDVHLLDCCAFS
ncbi:HigA family addiction module antidote protein [Pseudomonas phytophila]|uniref:HigA family addiction module antidote protein n=2 Tax=Pseudomonas TaxID=286 RepID=A0ABY6FA60_9PSED|nr:MULTISPECIES: HigA family addiction module antitoxin [Pseudomonas]MCQ2996004.1 HigA family addiction module antitoxin [Pseudomonas syringae]MCD5974739.1 HigA family addiction module antidote protein [Pseudomonas quasicaspiana]MCI8212037.1 XRE family transcriptional regulator [Pseudomonas sp. S25]MCQ3031786.1 HigA family addiction module antitoxin [Pseudomonas syringae]MDG6401922.1 HigA family addiction module antitoxin [Pseudomonas quasicaspiana]